MKNPDFQMISKGFGVESALCRERGDLKSALQTMMDFDGAYLLEVLVGKENNVFPMVPAGAAVADIRLE